MASSQHYSRALISRSLSTPSVLAYANNFLFDASVSHRFTRKVLRQLSSTNTNYHTLGSKQPCRDCAFEISYLDARLEGENEAVYEPLDPFDRQPPQHTTTTSKHHHSIQPNSQHTTTTITQPRATPLRQRNEITSKSYNFPPA